MKTLLGILYALGHAVLKSTERHGQFMASLLVAGIKPAIKKGIFDLAKPILPFDKDKPLGKWDVEVTFNEKGEVTRVVRHEDKKDVTAEVGKLPAFPEYAGRRVDMVLESRQTVETDAAKTIQKSVARAVLPGLRPWKFKDKEFKPEDLKDPNLVFEEKINGVGVEIHIDKEGKVSRVVSMRGQAVDLRDGLPELRDATLHESIRNSKILAEIRHPKGVHFTSGLLHATKENAEKSVKEHGHPKIFVLAVHKLGGHDTKTLKYDEMRSLRELVAKKLPHGEVPKSSGTTEAEKKGFREAVFRENRLMPVPACDGIVAYEKDKPNDGATIFREKPPVSFRVILMGHEVSKKVPGTAASFFYGDGIKTLGQVNIADPQMRVAVFQNPARYKGKVAVVEGSHRSMTTGSIFTPVLKSILWDEDPKSVKPWDPDAAWKEELEALYPDPAEREKVIQRKKSA